MGILNDEQRGTVLDRLPGFIELCLPYLAASLLARLAQTDKEVVLPMACARSDATCMGCS